MRRTVARALSALVATFTVALTTVSCVVLPVPVPIPVPAPDWQVSPEPEPAPSPSGTGLERFTEQ